MSEVEKKTQAQVGDSTLKWAAGNALNGGRISQADYKAVIRRTMTLDEAVRRVRDGEVERAIVAQRRAATMDANAARKALAKKQTTDDEEDAMEQEANTAAENQTEENAEATQEEVVAQEAPSWQIVGAVPGAEPKVLEELGGKLADAKARAVELFEGIDGPARVEVRAHGSQGKRKVLTRGDQSEVGRLPENAPDEAPDTPAEEPVAEEPKTAPAPAKPEKKGRAKNPLTFYTDGGQIGYRGVPSETVMAKKHNVVAGTLSGNPAMVNSVHVSPNKLAATAVLDDVKALDVAEITAKWDPAAKNLAFKGEPSEAIRSYLAGVYFPEEVTVKGSAPAEAKKATKKPAKKKGAATDPADAEVGAPSGSAPLEAPVGDSPGGDDPGAGLPELEVEPVEDADYYPDDE